MGPRAELRYDLDGYLDLSVFPDDPDVVGHAASVLEPLLARDRDDLERSLDRITIDEVLRRAGTESTSADQDLLPPTAATHPAPADLATAPTNPSGPPVEAAGDDRDEIEFEALLPPWSGPNRDGSATDDHEPRP